MVRRYIEILTIGILFFRSHDGLHSQDSFSTTFRPRLWENLEEWSLQVFLLHGVLHSKDSFPLRFRPRLRKTSSGAVVAGVFTARRPPFSGFPPLEVSSNAAWDILRSDRCRCFYCTAYSILRIPSPQCFVPGCGRHPQELSLQRLAENCELVLLDCVLYTWCIRTAATWLVSTRTTETWLVGFYIAAFFDQRFHFAHF